MDCRGHPLWELADILGVKKNNLLTNVMYPLLAMGIVEKAPPRPTTRTASLHPGKTEIPYILSTKSNCLESAWWCLLARDHELQAEKSKIFATMQASGFIPENYARRLTDIDREVTQIGKQMKALTILKENLRVLSEDEKEYLDILEELRLSNLSKTEFNEIFESLDMRDVEPDESPYQTPSCGMHAK